MGLRKVTSVYRGGWVNGPLLRIKLCSKLAAALHLTQRIDVRIFDTARCCQSMKTKVAKSQTKKLQFVIFLTFSFYLYFWMKNIYSKICIRKLHSNQIYLWVLKFNINCECSWSTFTRIHFYFQNKLILFLCSCLSYT